MIKAKPRVMRISTCTGAELVLLLTCFCPGLSCIGKNFIFLGGFMNHLNSVLIEGCLVREPLFRTTAKGTALCTFSIVTNRFYKQEGNLERETSYFDVETWTKLAEKCKSFGHKGRGIRVVGRLKQSRWTDADGKSKSRVSIIAEHIEFRPELKKEEDGGMHGEYASDGVFTGEAVPAF
jgi:single-strand DNA-binding protein